MPNPPKNNSKLEKVKDKFSKKHKSKVASQDDHKNIIRLPVGCQVVIGNMVEQLESKMIVDPANAETMDGNGGVSGAIKEYYKKIGKLKEYEADIHKVKPKNGLVCPNGEVRFTNTAGIEIVHTSVPDLRVKGNQVKGVATEESKQKMFEAYYHAFEFAHLHQVEHAKSLDCPLLGAGIFEWPPQLSAEIAGRALQAFRTAYEDGIQINICVRPVDFSEKFTQQSLVTAIQSGIENQVNQPLTPSGMSQFEIKDNYAMHMHFSTVSAESLQQHLNQYVAAGRAKSPNDAMLIDMLKEGFSKMTARDKRIDPRREPFLAFALISTLKEQCSTKDNQHGSPAFIKMCNDYLDKIAVLIAPDMLKKYAKDKKYIASLYDSLNLPALPNTRPSAPAFTQSEINLQYEPPRPSAPPFTESEANLQSPELSKPNQERAFRRPIDTQYSQLYPKPGVQSDVPASESPYADLTRVVKDIYASPLDEVINHLRSELANLDQQDMTTNVAHEIISPLMSKIAELKDSKRSFGDQVRLAEEMLKKAQGEAIMKNGGIVVVNIIHAILESKPNQDDKHGASPKNK